MAKRRYYFTLQETWERSVVVIAENAEEAELLVKESKWNEEHEFSQSGTADIILEDEEEID